MKHLIFLAPLLILAACRKHETPPPPPPTCLISQATFSGALVNQGPTKYTYDAQRHLIRSAESDTVITNFTRTADSIVAITTVKGRAITRTVITNNKDGLATNIHGTLDAAGELWFNVDYQYSGQELTRSVFITNTLIDSIVTNFTWSGGNMVSFSNDTTTSQLTYYTDQPRQQGDAFFFDQFTGGFEVTRNKNLLKSREGYTYTYQFRADGKITSVTAKDTAGDTFVTNYEYDCK